MTTVNFLLCFVVFSALLCHRLRERLGIAGSPIQDWWIHACCPLCAMLQEYNTLTARERSFNLMSTYKATRAGVAQAQALSRHPNGEAAMEGGLRAASPQGMDRGDHPQQQQQSPMRGGAAKPGPTTF